MNLEANLEALLFWKGEPISRKKVQTALGCSEADLGSAIAALSESLKTRGLRLMEAGEELELRTAPEASAMIERLTKEELMRDLGKAGLETLAIVLYQGPVRRADIDYIRGVNSSFILRNLLVRGLVERVSEKEGRGFLYRPTVELLAHLGVSKVDDLPEFAKVRSDIAAFESEQRAAEAPSPNPSSDPHES